MADKEPTQAMPTVGPDDALKGAFDGTNRPTKGAESAGGAYPRPRRGKQKTEDGGSPNSGASE